MYRVGFTFDSKKFGYYQRCREDPDNVLLRLQYLERLFNWLEDGREIIYMDETWINKNDVPSRCWHDGTKDTVDQVPCGKGARWIIIAAGGKNGWVPNTFQMWKGNIKSEDYHTEMNAQMIYTPGLILRLLLS